VDAGKLFPLVGETRTRGGGGTQPESKRKTLENRDEEKLLQPEIGGCVEFIATEGSGGQVIES